jgi:acetyl-CoA decarbonylase/synthase complex subunit gamma
MALKALDIYKLLPKTNCKECGFPTCLAFAMKLAAGKVDVEKCPCLDEETRAMLGGATRPPIQRIEIGVGERFLTIGEEFVMFRHEKTFYHEPGLMFGISDTLDADAAKAIADRAASEVVHRIGMDLRINGIAFRYESGSPERFGALVGAVEGCMELPEIVMALDPAAQAEALAHCGHYRPVIYAATEENHTEMCELAIKFGAPLAVAAEGIDALVKCVRACRDAGVKDILLDPLPPSLQDYVHMATAIRRRALTRELPELGYPLVIDTYQYPFTDVATALGILKYAGVIVTPPLSPAASLAALTLRQNIYTDPQKPIQVTPGLYPVNGPGSDAPLLMTVNFSLTYFTLLGYLEASKIPCYLFIVDTEGLSVLTAVAGGKLDEVMVADALREFGVEEAVDHHVIIIPGYAAPLSGRIEEETGWTVKVGPRDASEIGEYLEKEWRK